MENKIKNIIKEFANPREETLDNAVKRICALFKTKEMKTPMQQVFAHLRASKESDGFGEAYCVDWLLEMEESMLEKEKEVIVNAWVDDRFPLDKKEYGEQYYNITFKTKER